MIKPEKIEVTVKPDSAGKRLVRMSLPLPRGFMQDGYVLAARDPDGMEHRVGARVLTRHSGCSSGSARRVMATWTADFSETEPVVYEVFSRPEGRKPVQHPHFPLVWNSGKNGISLEWEGGPVVSAGLIAPEPVCSEKEPERTVVESNEYYHWEYVKTGDVFYPRIIELRADILGRVVLVAHVQRNLPGNDYAPELGWELDLRRSMGRLAPGEENPASDGSATHNFDNGAPCFYTFEKPAFTAYHPVAPHRLAGKVTVNRNSNGRCSYRYLRSEESDLVPWQQSAWLRFETVIAPEGAGRLSPALRERHEVEVEQHLWDELYDTGNERMSTRPELASVLAQNRELILKCAARGHDFGNIISFDEKTGKVGDYPMNRLNHCPPIFLEGWLTGDRRLTEAALLWCENFSDLTIWWGDRYTGGTRYNYGPALDHHPPQSDPGDFEWRSNRAVDFCTKGFDSFFLAWEETGDPVMLRALNAQTDAASQLVHANSGETRNIGIVRDFVMLYRYTGDRNYLEQALRLFRELKEVLWPDGLFDQSGKPKSPELPFIDVDADSEGFGYAKPYILGYALAGLPLLLKECPKEPELRKTVEAVADFLVDVQDPSGGWRYPHPLSSGLSLGRIEHAWQIAQADRVLGTCEKHLNAVEMTLKALVHGLQRSGTVITGVSGWERSTGRLPEGEALQELYSCPEDRDYEHDYDEGDISLGSVSPDGMVYVHEILYFYLRNRTASSLLDSPEPGSPLARILDRLPEPGEYQTRGVKDELPVFAPRALKKLRWPLSRLSCRAENFSDWRRSAREFVKTRLLQAPPPAVFNPIVIAEEDRGSYVSRKVAFSLTGDSRVLSYVLVPKGKGPFPGVLLLHDHGARFDIGKEKVVRPFGVPPEKASSARQWSENSYGGRFLGDELAGRGYVCLAVDMLNWSDRGGGGYEQQQALAANLMHMGMSFAGVIAHEDMKAAEFLANLPGVDRNRTAAIGHSVGGYRTWQLAALSENISAGASICWMATIKGQMQEGVNQTRGQSAFTMVHPGLAPHLDFPDVASIACPKPMLFYNGLQDRLFAPEDVQAAYDKMHRVWDSQGAGELLETKLWDVPHEFSVKMQDEAFSWLESAF